MEGWEGKFNKKPDPDYILSVLIDIYERQYGCKVEVTKTPPPVVESPTRAAEANQ